MSTARQVLQFLDQAHRRGERSVLVAIAHVVLASSRNPGTLLGVSETGAWCGSLSGGCVEAAVIAEALRVLAQGRAELLRLGAGSPLIDIRLPCGGGLDLLIVPEPDATAVAGALALLNARQPVTLEIGLAGGLIISSLQPTQRATWYGQRLTVRLEPGLRIVVIGLGEEVIALARLGLAYGADVTALTPDQDAVTLVAAMGATAHQLLTPAASPLLQTDAATAVVLLFHDHDWEQALLAQALDQPALLIGAMGSRRTHALRLDAMRCAGIPEAKLARIEGPVGLIAMTRDPATLALSVLARIAQAYQGHCDRLCDGHDSRTTTNELDRTSAI